MRLEPESIVMPPDVESTLPKEPEVTSISEPWNEPENEPERVKLFCLFCHSAPL